MIEIRKATITDLEGVQRLNKLLFEKELREYKKPLNCKWNFGKEGIKYFKKQIPKGNVFVAVDKNNVVGYVSCISYEGEKWRTIKKIGELDSMLILEEYRSQGIGKQLFQEFFKWCKSHNVDRIKVIAAAENKRAIEFYRKNGFKDYDLILESDI
jgi:ribosomal protein S18 acetylase RimI-like enzyme